MDSRMVLYLLIAVAGFVMVVGGMWLIYKQKIYIDRESGQPITVELPGNFKFTSNYPALALFALGFVPLIYPVHELPQLTQFQKVKNVRIQGVIRSEDGRKLVQPNVSTVVYAAEVPAYPMMRSEEEFSLGVPVISGKGEYQVMLVVNGHVVDYQKASAKDDSNVIKVEFHPVDIEPALYAGEIQPVPAEFR
jgi:hypothetical protein